jgi:ureidoglycolate hydrolase
MKVYRLTRKNIALYGWIIDSACVNYKADDNGFGIVFKERSSGWRIAYLVVRRKSIERLECHPNTAETFEPVKGRAIIALAGHSHPDRFKLFVLDRPVVLRKGVWHNVMAMTKNCEIKICEGMKVVEKYHKLKIPILSQVAVCAQNLPR